VSSNQPLTDAEIDIARAATPGADRVAHLNHAGSSLPSQAVLDHQIQYLRREAEIGGYETAAEHHHATAGVYDSIGRLIGAEPNEIARANRRGSR